MAATRPSVKEILAPKTGITLHHVQLMAYHAFRSLCCLPQLELHLPILLTHLCAWFDAHQRTLLPTTLRGAVIKSPPPTGGVGAGAEAAEDAAVARKMSRAVR